MNIKVDDDPYEMLIPASTPEFDDLTKKEKMKAGGNHQDKCDYVLIFVPNNTYYHGFQK